jgi:hypothetical protein
MIVRKKVENNIFYGIKQRRMTLISSTWIIPLPRFFCDGGNGMIHVEDNRVNRRG